MIRTDSFAMPWRIGLHIRRIVSSPYIRLRCQIAGVRWGKRWRIFGTPIIQRHRGSRIILGNGLELRSWPRSNPLMPHHPVVFATRSGTATIFVGEDCGFTGATLVAESRIEIGDRVLVGSNTTIVDTDFHPLDPEARRRDVNSGSTRPIVIEDDVFIGMNCLILKGVRIGRGAVVGAGSVVRSDIPANTLCSGNPARPHQVAAHQ